MLKIFYKLTVFILLISSINLFPQDFWKAIESPTNQNLKAVEFLDSLNGWIGGDSGVLLHTTNGGITWNQQLEKFYHDIKFFYFLNDSVGWALAWNTTEPPNGTIILKTINAGEQWTATNYSDDNYFMNAVYFKDTLNGFIGGYGSPGGIRRTFDGGITWREVDIDSGGNSLFPVEGFAFYNNQYGYAYGGQIDAAGVIWRTTNGGDSWYSTPIASEPIFDFHFFDSLNVLGIMSDPDLFGTGTVFTSDAGDTWDFKRLELFGISPAMDFRTESEGWIVQSGEKRFIVTQDSGNTWDTLSAPGDPSLYDIEFTDSLTGYAVGDDGVILKYKKIPVSVENENDLSRPEKFILNQNYPNPFNPITTIRYSIPGNILNTANVKLEVYNILGNKIKTLVNSKKQSGVYEVSFNGNNLSSGIYFYRIYITGNTNNYTSTKSMILLK